MSIASSLDFNTPRTEEPPIIGFNENPESGIAIEIVPEITGYKLYDVMRRDQFVKSGPVQDDMLRFSLFARYRAISSREEINEIQSLNTELFEQLRESGALLYDNQTQSYYLLVEMADLVLRSAAIDFQQGVESSNNAFRTGVTTAKNMNGIVQGVESNTIHDVANYIVEQGFADADSIRGTLQSEIARAQNIMATRYENGVISTSYVQGKLVDQLVSLNFDNETTEVELSQVLEYLNAIAPESYIRQNVYMDAVDRLLFEDKSKIFRLAEMSGDLKWSVEPIESAEDLIQAITPDNAPDMVTRAVADLMMAYPAWESCKKQLVDYIFQRFDELRVKFNVDTPDFDHFMQKSYILVQKGIDVVLELRKNAERYKMEVEES